MLPMLISILRWIKDNVLAIVIISFVIPGVLAVFNQQSEITKTIYETDYKSAKAKFQECDRLHSEYLSVATNNAGLAQILQDNFNLDAIAKYGSSEVYFIAFKGTMESYQNSLGQIQKSFTSSSQCYSELNSIYENLALALNVNDEFHEETMRGTDKILSLVAKRDAIKNDISKRVNLNTMFRALISGDAKSLQTVMQIANFGDLAKLQSQNIEVESAVQNQQRTQFAELNKLFSKELNHRFHRGLLSYFWSLFGI